jgi:hypothetical protein
VHGTKALCSAAAQRKEKRGNKKNASNALLPPTAAVLCRAHRIVSLGLELWPPACPRLLALRVPACPLPRQSPVSHGHAALRSGGLAHSDLTQRDATQQSCRPRKEDRKGGRHRHGPRPTTPDSRRQYYRCGSASVHPCSHGQTPRRPHHTGGRYYCRRHGWRTTRGGSNTETGGLEPRYRRSDHRALSKCLLHIYTYSNLEGEVRNKEL